jgi:hypothetical protein
VKAWAKMKSVSSLSSKRSLDAVSLLGEEVTPMARHKPKLPEEAAADKQTVRSPLVRRLDLKALHVPQGPDSGINAIMGKWPGDESEEEILAALEELS